MATFHYLFENIYINTEYRPYGFDYKDFHHFHAYPPPLAFRL